MVCVCPCARSIFTVTSSPSSHQLPPSLTHATQKTDRVSVFQLHLYCHFCFLPLQPPTPRLTHSRNKENRQRRELSLSSSLTLSLTQKKKDIEKSCYFLPHCSLTHAKQKTEKRTAASTSPSGSNLHTDPQRTHAHTQTEKRTATSSSPSGSCCKAYHSTSH